ncbi:MAG TPA: class I SAM-dependent methyltransferase [Blastocatellia bacterium]|nr:class I SAM-dependent methyltransferase [Blastocatellia bacterium]
MNSEPLFAFDRQYLDYWHARVEHASDGTRVPGLEVAASLVERLGIRQGERVLDVGCGFGRLLPVLAPLTDCVMGLDVAYDVIDEAARRGYRCVVRGGAEDSNLPSDFFAHLVLFGVFDCCDQSRALVETRRLLTAGGTALITGKNVDYEDDDRLALLAERNAWRKNFPNSFTCASRMAEFLPAYGLELVELLRFARRGDFGELRVLPSTAAATTPFYEYAAIVRAVDQSGSPAADMVSSRTSRTAERVANDRGFTSVEELFRSTYLDAPVA